MARSQEDAPMVVIPTPRIFKDASSSPKTQAETVIVMTSLKIPAILIGTTPARLMILHRGRDVLAKQG
jgi:hypothetical protein